MTEYHIKHLPTGTLPEGGVGVRAWSVTRDGVASRSVSGGGVATWAVADAERWRKAAVPAVLAPAVGGWVLAVLVAAAYVLLFGLSSASAAWHSGPGDGTDWLRYPGLILLTALPLWYRYVPVAAIAAAAESDDHRGHEQVYLGLALCLVAAVILIEGLFGDPTASGIAYDAVGQQRIGLVLLVAGTTFYGRGQLAHRAARRLHEEPQPALIVGVRAGADGRHWVCADARTRSAAPLIAYVPLKSDTRARTRLLGSGSAYGVGNGHHDIDPKHEPFEAVLYGIPVEGDEVVLEYACAEYHLHQEMGRMYATVTTAPLRPDRHHGLGPWEPADGPARQRERLREGREKAERYREAQREAEERRRNSPRGPSSRGRGSGSGNRRSRGGHGSSCGSSCGGD